MATALITHPACLEHNIPPGHPERPARLSEILKALEADEFRALERKTAPRARSFKFRTKSANPAEAARRS